MRNSIKSVLSTNKIIKLLVCCVILQVIIFVPSMQVHAAENITTVTTPSGTGILYNSNTGNANQDTYVFSYNIGDAATNSANDNNTATITGYNLCGTGDTITIPQYVYVKYTSGGTTKKYTLKVTTVGNGTSALNLNNDTSYTSLKLSIPNATTISNNAFKNYTLITKVNIGGNVTSIGASAFEGCTSLENIYYVNSDSTVNYTLRGTVLSVGDRAFYNCTKLEQLTIARGVNTLQRDTFGGSTPLTTLKINGNIPNHNGAFQGKSTIQTLILGANATVIYDNMFRDCDGLTKVDISNVRVTDIGDYAFYNCNNLTSKNAFDFGAIGPNLTGNIGKYALKFGGLSTAGTIAGKPNVEIHQTVEETNNYFPSDGIAKVTMSISAESAQANEGSDYVICLDGTGSMGSGWYCDKCGKCNNATTHTTTGCNGNIKNQWIITKETLCNFVENTLTDNNKNRIAITMFYPRSINDGAILASAGGLLIDFTSDKALLLDKITNLNLAENRDDVVVLCTSNTDGGTNYSQGLLAAAKTVQARGGQSQTSGNFTFGGTGGADRPVNLIFVSDGEPNANQDYIEPLSKACKAIFDNCWSIGICVSATTPNVDAALRYLKYINTTLNGQELFEDITTNDMEKKMRELFAGITTASKASTYNTVLTSTIDSSKWDFYTNISWSDGVTTDGNDKAYVNIGLVDDDSKSYTYYVRLKDSFRRNISTAGTHQAQVLTKLSTTYKISGGQYANLEQTLSRDYSDSLPWYAYNIIYNGNGNTGGSTANQVKIGGIDLTLQINGFTKANYKFKEWNTQADGKGTKYTENKMYKDNRGLTLYAIWEPELVNYTVKHFKQNIDGTYPSIPADTDILKGKPNTSVTPSVKSYTGFNSPVNQTVTIKIDGSTVVNYYYTRKSYTVTLKNGLGIALVGGSGTYKYEQQVNIKTEAKVGYTFKNWTGTYTLNNKNETITMPAQNVTLTANATPNPDTPYKVNHYLMNIIDDNYTLKETEYKTGTTDTKVTPPVKSYNGFTSPATQTVNINGDGSTVVNYYYTRNYYKLTLIAGKGIQYVTGGGVYKHDTQVNIDAIAKPGYTFKNWTGTFTVNIKKHTFSMPIYNITLTANAIPNTDTPYMVRHWVQKVTAISTEHNDTNYELVDTEYLKGTTDTVVTPSTKTLTGKYEGCIAPPLQSKNIEGNGSTIIDYYYTRTKVTFDVNGQEIAKQILPNTNGLCTFDVYINNIKVANDVTDYYNTNIVYGSTFEVKDIKPIKNKNYKGADVN